MSRLLDVCRRYVEVAAEAEASSEEVQAVAAIQAAAASQAVEEAKAAAEEAKAAAAEATAAAVAQAAAVANAAAAALAAAVTPAPGSVGAIKRMLQDALQGPGHSDAGLVAGLTAGLPTDQQIQIVLPFLQDPSEGLVPARVATALFQGFGRPAAATVAALLAAPPTASCAPDAGLSAPGAASGDRLGAGLGASASEAAVAGGLAGLASAPSRPDAAAAATGLLGLGVPASAEAASEDEARRAYQRQHLNLAPPLDSKFHDYGLPDDPAVALPGLQVIGKAQDWRALEVGDARALVEAVQAAWGSGDHGSLSLAARTALAAVTVMSEFGDGLLAEILASTPSGQRGFAVWQASQAACGDFIVASADRAAVANPLRASQAVDLRAANKAGEASALGARVDGLVAVLSSSKRPATKEDGKLVADHLGEAVTDWQSGARPIQAVQQAVTLVRRSHLVMKQAGWVHNYTQLEDIQRILLGNDIGRRSPSWLQYGAILAEYVRTQMLLETAEEVIVRGLETRAETMTPTASLFLGSDLSTITRSSAASRLKDLESKSAMANKEAEARSTLAKREAEARSARAKAASSGSAPAPSGSKPAKTLAHVAAVGRPGLAPVPGRDGVTAPGPAACRFCAAPGHRVDQCPTVEYVPGRSGTIDAKWCKCFACSSFGHKQQDCPSLAQKNGVPPSATAAVGGASV